MSDTGIIICMILLFMGVPDLCRLLGRPALAYPTFVICGLSLAPLSGSWMIRTGLFITVPAIFLLPKPTGEGDTAPRGPSATNR